GEAGAAQEVPGGQARLAAADHDDVVLPGLRRQHGRREPRVRPGARRPRGPGSNGVVGWHRPVRPGARSGPPDSSTTASSPPRPAEITILRYDHPAARPSNPWAAARPGPRPAAPASTGR